MLPVITFKCQTIKLYDRCTRTFRMPSSIKMHWLPVEHMSCMKLGAVTMVVRFRIGSKRSKRSVQ